MKFMAVILSVIFLTASLATLTHYGVNWDTINHLPRGQAYLHYFLTGKKDYSDLPKYFNDWNKIQEWYWQDPSSLLIKTNLPREKVPERSLYQIDAFDFKYFVDNDGYGHPPLSDILAAASNRIFFQKLKLINDIDSYRVYGVVLAASLSGLLFYWISSYYGPVAGFVSFLSLSLYPLFWSESHFNTEKDIPETVYWTFLMFFFWKGIVKKNWRYLLISGVFAGLALGTKFNIVFSVFVFLPWLIAYYYKKDLKKEIKLSLILATASVPIIAFLIFVASWPYLWPDIFTRIAGVLNFYKSIGTGEVISGRFIGPFGVNTFPLVWIFLTSPLIILSLSLIGIFNSITTFWKEKNKLKLLFLLWFLVPIVRVSFPGTSNYGGVRQLMEFIPAAAVLSGLGGKTIFEFLDKRLSTPIPLLVLILPFAFLTLNLAKIHPNENVYFNELVGGLAGAKAKDIPYWGFSFGAPYREGIVWLNKNAPFASRLAYARSLIPNVPRLWVRPDLVLHNGNRSGSLREGEYIIDLTYRGVEETSYFDRYLQRFLEPVYEVRVDGAAILTVWKNDAEHTRPEYLKDKPTKLFKISKKDFGLEIEFPQVVKLSSIQGRFNENAFCKNLFSSYVEISTNGQRFERLPGMMPNEDWSVPKFGNQPKRDSFFIPFAADSAEKINLIISPANACMKDIRELNVRIFD